MRALILFLCLVAGSAQAQVVEYMATDLGTLGGVQSEASAINNLCQIPPERGAGAQSRWLSAAPQCSAFDSSFPRK